MNNKKIFCALMLSSATLISCGTSDSGNVDNTKKQLIVCTPNCGVGKEWIEASAKQFEKEYENVTFGDGKTGVQIQIRMDNSFYGDNNSMILGLKNDVYFTENVDYFSYLSRNALADLTDVVKSKIEGEDRTIEDKIDPSFKQFLTAKDGKYYALPYYDGLSGFIYDGDVFEELALYFDEDGEIGATKEAGNLSLGADGVAGTYDDGLPATYAQFGTLLDELKSTSYKVGFAGGMNDDPGYFTRVLTNFWSNYEGREQMMLNYNFSGTATNLRKGNGENETLDINLGNGYELQRQAGKYHTLKFVEDILKPHKNDVLSNNAYQNTAIQNKFIRSSISSADKYAIISEGSWWENEASAYFAEMGKYSKTKANSNYGFLPIPKVDETHIGEKQTVMSLNRSFAFANANSKELDLAKAFLKFTTSDAQMSQFTKCTSITRAFSYELTPDDYEATSPFGRSVIEYKNSSNVIYPYCPLEIAQTNVSYFSETNWAWSTDSAFRTPPKFFSSIYNDTMSAEAYFNSLYTVHKNGWPNK